MSLHDFSEFSGAAALLVQLLGRNFYVQIPGLRQSGARDAHGRPKPRCPRYPQMDRSISNPPGRAVKGFPISR